MPVVSTAAWRDNSRLITGRLICLIDMIVWSVAKKHAFQSKGWQKNSVEEEKKKEDMPLALRHENQSENATIHENEKGMLRLQMVSGHQEKGNYLPSEQSEWMEKTVRKGAGIMETTKAGTKEEKEWYVYRDFPKNIRQMGIPLPGTKIYMEDYVMTYLKQEFGKAGEGCIALLIGTKGQEKAREALFVYGAIALEEQIFQEESMDKTAWKQVYGQMQEAFPGAKILGWACGVAVWNSQIDRRVHRIQDKYFAQEQNILFLEDMGEREERIYLWEQGGLQEQTGYYAYYEKNPQMREFMLGTEENESIDDGYQDRVTHSMRQIIETKEEDKEHKLQRMTYGGIAIAALAVLLGVHLMMDSSSRIRSMEQTVNTLSEYVGQRQDTLKNVSAETKELNQKLQDGQAEETADPGAEDDSKTDSSAAGDSEAGESKADSSDAKNEADDHGTAGTAAGNVWEQNPQARAVTAKSNMQNYIVQKGDTLSQILWRQYHSLSYKKKVKKINNISDEDKIYEGQCLFLPDKK